MALQKKVESWLWPKRATLFRLLLVAAASLILFSSILLPFQVAGESMAPTYQSGSFNFCWVPAYLFKEPARFDIVLIAMAGHQVMLLKRVVALPGETIAFEQGQLLINGQPVDEPHVQRAGNWTLPARQVQEGTVYVVGDNRAMAIEEHVFGASSLKRIKGRPLW